MTASGTSDWTTKPRRRPVGFVVFAVVAIVGIVALKAPRNLRKEFEAGDPSAFLDLAMWVGGSLVVIGVGVFLLLLVQGRNLSSTRRALEAEHPQAIVLAGVPSGEARSALKDVLGAPSDGGRTIPSTLTLVADADAVDFRSGSTPLRSIHRLEWTSVRSITGGWARLDTSRVRGITLELERPGRIAVRLPVGVAGEGAFATWASHAPSEAEVDDLVRRLEALRRDAASRAARER